MSPSRLEGWPPDTGENSPGRGPLPTGVRPGPRRVGGLGEGKSLRRRRTPALSVVAACLALSGCTQSHLAETQAVHLHGQVVDGSGHPASGVVLHLFKQADIGEAFGGLIAIAATIGFACLAPQAPTICQGGRSATTGGDGQYTFDLTGSDTQGAVGQASTFDLTATFPPVAGSRSGPTTTASLMIQQPDLPLPDLHQWAAVAVASTVGGTLTLSAPAFAGDGGGSPRYRLRALDVHGRELWSADADPGHGSLDARVLEDLSGSGVLEALTSLSAPQTGVDLVYTTAPAAVRGAGAPPSRNAPCSVVNSDQSVHALSPCPLTDGDLVGTASTVVAGCAACAGTHTAVIVDLGSRRQLSLLVIRGGTSQLNAELSDDQVSWRPYATGDGGELALTGSGAGRYLRVRGPAGLDVSGLTEISAWS